ncbi:hypothetical protein NR798_39780 [Archangium gephyra]
MGPVEEAKEIAQDALLALLDKAHQCRAIDHASPEYAERAAWAWAFTVVYRKMADFFRAQARARQALAELSQTDDEAVATGEDAQSVFEELVDIAEEAARKLIETREPVDLYRDARADEVAATVDKVARDIDSFRQVKLHGRRCLDVAKERGCEGPDPRLQNLVSKQVERGKKALHYGSLAAARTTGPLERERLEGLARGLLQVGKTS